eukprot:TRINITY_DN2843_c0_g3_i2.p1 TRINITY_DN2843_c0_g3~~TRINITY_DN2843_c0_g3_i2.p1  ORF type:complete len:917 (+),score=344.67 TRINITY_DN2843_c0_g3_i2:122-2872(+)
MCSPDLQGWTFVQIPQFHDFGRQISQPPNLLKGEEVICYFLYVKDVNQANRNICGSIYLTNYSLIFVSSNYFMDFQKIQIPLASIATIENNRAKNLVEITCKNFRIQKFEFQTDNIQKAEYYMYQFMKNIDAICFFKLESAFAFQHDNKGGWGVYKAKNELIRMQAQDNWRITKINEDFKTCESYPQKLTVPKCICDEDLEKARTFRSRYRIPVLSWHHSVTKATITRASQPNTGVTFSRNQFDEYLIQGIIKSSTSKFYIIDCRGRLNALVNQVAGAGTEIPENYENATLLFMGIGNIHAMRRSLKCLFELCQTEQKESYEKFNTDYVNTKWAAHLTAVIAGAQRIVSLIKSEISVLIHCSDGWDRTSQLSSLAQIMLDSFYRTKLGFQILIEKEWISMGHKFAHRCGHGQKNFWDNNDCAPIFLQWVDCIWQLMNQHPNEFEFNESYLIEILDNVYSCRFGTFLCDNQNQSVNLKVVTNTQSLWPYLNEQTHFVNKDYKKSENILEIDYTGGNLAFWESYYCRYFTRPLKTLAINHFNSRETNKLKRSETQHEKQIEELKKQLQNALFDKQQLESEYRRVLPFAMQLSEDGSQTDLITANEFLVKNRSRSNSKILISNNNTNNNNNNTNNTNNNSNSNNKSQNFNFDEFIIETKEQLVNFCENIKLNNLQYIAFDTEFLTPRDKLCLIQVAAGNELVLIDTVKLNNKDLESFVAILVDKNILKIVHAASEDLRLFYKSFSSIINNNLIGPIHDIQIAEEFLGANKTVGLATIVNDQLKINLDKSEQLSNWIARPLTPKQIQYAFNDIRYLQYLYNRQVQFLIQFDNFDFFDARMAELEQEYKNKSVIKELTEVIDNYLLAHKINKTQVYSKSEVGHLISNLPDLSRSNLVTGWRKALLEDVIVNFLIAKGLIAN